MAPSDYTTDMPYINRRIEDVLKRLIESFPVVAVTGPRQAGKSTLLTNTLPQYTYVSLEDPMTRNRALSDPVLFLDSLGERVIIDEIQYAPQLLSYIKPRLEPDKKGLYIFTSSQQFNTIKGLGDSLAGNIALLELLPFSLSEIRKPSDLNYTESFFAAAALTGSYPALQADRTVDAYAWYGSYLQTYLERDVRGLHNVNNLRGFQLFMQLLATRCSQVLDMSSLANAVGVSVPTIKTWLSVLEAGRIIYLLPPYHNNLGKRIVKAPKVYFLDIGMVCYLTGIRDKLHLLQGPMAAQLFENYVVQETVKVFSNAGISPRLYFLRTSNNLEVDLLLEDPSGALLPVEIKFTKTPAYAMGKGIRRFKSVFSALNIEKGLVVSLGRKHIELSEDISAVTLENYLETIDGRASG